MKDGRIDKRIEDTPISLELVVERGGGGGDYLCLLKIFTIFHTGQHNIGQRHKRGEFISCFTFQGSSIKSQPGEVGGELLGIFGEEVRLSSPNPDLISEQMCHFPALFIGP